MNYITLLCKVCNGRLIFDRTGSMGSRHSNIYRCNGCKREVEIYDDEIDVVIKR